MCAGQRSRSRISQAKTFGAQSFCSISSSLNITILPRPPVREQSISNSIPNSTLPHPSDHSPCLSLVRPLELSRGEPFRFPQDRYVPLYCSVSFSINSRSNWLSKLSLTLTIPEIVFESDGSRCCWRHWTATLSPSEAQSPSLATRLIRYPLGAWYEVTK